MTINSDTTREELWQSNLGRHHSLGFKGTSLIQRERFIEGTLGLWRTASSPIDRDLISDLVEAVSLNDGRWPRHEPDRTIRGLVECVTNAEGVTESEQRRCVTTLQALLLEFADRVESGNTIFSSAADLLVGAILDALKNDVDNLRKNLLTTKAYPLALMLAPNFSAIPSRRQRSAYIKLLRKLVRSESKYNHPFLEDLVLIYDKMDLKHLDYLLEKSSASHS